MIKRKLGQWIHNFILIILVSSPKKGKSIISEFGPTEGKVYFFKGQIGAFKVWESSCYA